MNPTPIDGMRNSDPWGPTGMNKAITSSTHPMPREIRMTSRDVRMATSNCRHASGPAPPSQGSLGNPQPGLDSRCRAARRLPLFAPLHSIVKFLADRGRPFDIIGVELDDQDQQAQVDGQPPPAPQPTSSGKNRWARIAWLNTSNGARMTRPGPCVPEVPGEFGKALDRRLPRASGPGQPRTSAPTPSRIEPACARISMFRHDLSGQRHGQREQLHERPASEKCPRTPRSTC